METQPKFAVFDIDGTLIRWQLFHAITHGLGKHGYIPASTHEAIRTARMNWKTRGGNFKSYEKVLVHAYLSAITEVRPDDYRAIVDEVFEEYKDQTYIYTRDLVASLKKQGYLLFSISGSQTDIVKKLADYYGFDDVVAAELEEVDGRFTGKDFSPIHDKQAALETLVKRHDATYAGSIAVGDSEGDIPMLSMVERAIAFNPSRELFTVAAKEGWQIVVERKNMVYQLDNHDGTYVLAEAN